MDSGKEGEIRTRQKMAASTEQYLRNAGESGMVLATFGRVFFSSNSWHRAVSAQELWRTSLRIINQHEDSNVEKTG